MEKKTHKSVAEVGRKQKFSKFQDSICNFWDTHFFNLSIPIQVLLKMMGGGEGRKDSSEKAKSVYG